MIKRVQFIMFDKISSFSLFWTLVLLTAFACDPGDNNSSINDSDTGDTASSAWSTDSDSGEYVEVLASCNDVVTTGTIFLTDSHNYTFDSTVSIQEVTVKDATDLTFEWGSLTQDFFGDTLNPMLDIDMLLVALFEMTGSELAENIRRDNVPISENKGAIAYFPSEQAPVTSQNLFNFVAPVDRSPLTVDQIMGYFDTTAPDYFYPQDTHSFMFVAATGDEIGKNSRMIGIFHLDPFATETTVALTNNSMVVDFKTNLAQIMPIPIPMGTGALSVSWEYMTKTALGNEFIATQITEVKIGHYTNLTRPQLDNQFLDLMELPENTWSFEMEEAAFGLDLSLLKNDQTGQPFSGIDSTGVWILALFCTKNCNNPAPWSITILQAC